MGPGDKEASQGDGTGTQPDPKGKTLPTDPKGKEGEGGKARDAMPGRSPFARNIVAIGEGEQGGFEGIVASNKAMVPRDHKKFDDPQMEAQAFQEALLEASQPQSNSQARKKEPSRPEGEMIN